MTPSVLSCGDRDSTATVEVHIVGREDVVDVSLIGPNETYLLYDDGTHGDAMAGDLTFTVAGVRPFCHSALSLQHGRTIGSWSGALEARLGDGTTVAADRSVVIGFVSPRYDKPVDVVYYPDGLSATAYAFFIQDIDSAVFDGYPVCTTDARVASCEALRALYSILPDAFDLAIVMSGRTMFSAGTYAEMGMGTLRTANDVEHTGVPIFNDASACGSSGRLRGVVFAPFGSMDLIDSEILNIWGADLGVPLGLAYVASSGSSFWNPYSDAGGQLASYIAADDGTVGFLTSNGDGTWRLVSPSENQPYSPLELYILGLVPAGEVPPIHVLSGLHLSDAERITADDVRTITIDDIMAAHGGVRSPTPENSPLAFSVAFVVVQDEPFTDAEYAYFSLLARHLASRDRPEELDMYAPFFWATGGRATLDPRLPVAAKPIETH